jgi:hypothetical protein
MILGNPFQRDHHFPLGYFIYGIDMIDPFMTFLIPLMDSIDPDMTWLPMRLGFNPFPDF